MFTCFWSCFKVWMFIVQLKSLMCSDQTQNKMLTVLGRCTAAGMFRILLFCNSGQRFCWVKSILAHINCPEFDRPWWVFASLLIYEITSATVIYQGLASGDRWSLVQHTSLVLALQYWLWTHDSAWLQQTTGFNNQKPAEDSGSIWTGH